MKFHFIGAGDPSLERMMDRSQGHFHFLQDMRSDQTWVAHAPTNLITASLSPFSGSHSPNIGEPQDEYIQIPPLFHLELYILHFEDEIYFDAV